MASAGRNRAATSAFVVAVLVGARWLVPDEMRRQELQYLIVLPLGYGHLIGALLFGRVHHRWRVPGWAPPRLFWAFVAVSLLTGFAIYLQYFHALMLVPMGVAFVWHAVENDLELGRSYSADLRLGPLPRAPDRHLAAAGIVCLLIWVAADTDTARELAGGYTGGLARAGASVFRAAAIGSGLMLLWRGQTRWLGAALVVLSAIPVGWLTFHLTLHDLVAAGLLYHALSWLLYFIDRAHALRAKGQTRAARRLLLRLLMIHAGPLTLGVTMAWGQAMFGPVYLLLSTPAAYLYWSLVHVFQTALVRGLEAPPRRVAWAAR